MSTRLPIAQVIVGCSALLLGACKSGNDAAEKNRATPATPAALVAAPETAVEEDAAPVREIVTIPPPRHRPNLPRGLPNSVRRGKGDSDALFTLGELLFFDGRLSASGTMACSSCHDPDKGFADGLVRNDTVTGKANLRHTPTLYNDAWAPAFYWDGRVDSLETAIIANWQGQMGGDPDLIAQLLSEVPEYSLHAERALGARLTTEGIVRALAAFLVTIYSGDSPWDRFEAGDTSAVSEAAVRGFGVFSNRAQCAVCHPPPLYTDFRFHDVGLARGLDPGRAVATKKAADEAAFKTPTLRGLTSSAPYFHDGSAESLAAVLEVELAALSRRSGRPVVLSDEERADLLAFLVALSPPPSTYLRPVVPAGTR